MSGPAIAESIPPGVDSGEVQGEVEFSASNVELKGRGTQEAIKLGICWWGATADGLKRRIPPTQTVLFPVKTTLGNLSSYLADAGSVEVVVFLPKDPSPVARARVQLAVPKVDSTRTTFNLLRSNTGDLIDEDNNRVGRILGLCLMLRFQSSSLLRTMIGSQGLPNVKALEFMASNRIFDRSRATGNNVSFEMNEVVSNMDEHLGTLASERQGAEVDASESNEATINSRVQLGVDRARRVYNTLTRLRNVKASKSPAVRRSERDLCSKETANPKGKEDVSLRNKGLGLDVLRSKNELLKRALSLKQRMDDALLSSAQDLKNTEVDALPGFEITERQSLGEDRISKTNMFLPVVAEREPSQGDLSLSRKLTRETSETSETSFLEQKASSRFTGPDESKRVQLSIEIIFLELANKDRAEYYTLKFKVDRAAKPKEVIAGEGAVAFDAPSVQSTLILELWSKRELAFLGLTRIPLDRKLPIREVVVVRDLSNVPVAWTKVVVTGQTQKREENAPAVHNGLLSAKMRPAEPTRRSAVLTSSSDVTDASSSVLGEETHLEGPHEPSATVRSEKPVERVSAKKKTYCFTFQFADVCPFDTAGCEVTYQFPPGTIQDNSHRHVLWWDGTLPSRSSVGSHQLECTPSDLSDYLNSGVVFNVGAGETRRTTKLSQADLSHLVEAAGSGRRVESFTLALSATNGNTEALPLTLPLTVECLQANKISAKAASPSRLVISKEKVEAIVNSDLCIQICRVIGLEECLQQKLPEAVAPAQSLGFNAFLVVKLLDNHGNFRFHHRTNTHFRTFNPIFDEEVLLRLKMEEAKLLPTWFVTFDLFHLEVPQGRKGSRAASEVSLSSVTLPLDMLLNLKSPEAKNANFKMDRGGEVRVSIFFEQNRLLGSILTLPKQRSKGALGDTNKQDQPAIISSPTSAFVGVAKDKASITPANSSVLPTADSSIGSGDNVDHSLEAGGAHEPAILARRVEAVRRTGLEALVTVEAALHLPLLQRDDEVEKPCAYVVIESPVFSRCRTAVHPPSCAPNWNETFPILIPSSGSLRQDLKLCLWSHQPTPAITRAQLFGDHANGSRAGLPGRDFDPYATENRLSRSSLPSEYDGSLGEHDEFLGTAIVDLGAFSKGTIEEINGWYHLIDAEQRRIGQLKVRVSRAISQAQGVKEDFKLKTNAELRWSSEAAEFLPGELARSVMPLEQVKESLLRRFGGGTQRRFDSESLHTPLGPQELVCTETASIVADCTHNLANKVSCLQELKLRAAVDLGRSGQGEQSDKKVDDPHVAGATEVVETLLEAVEDGMEEVCTLESVEGEPVQCPKASTMLRLSQDGSEQGGKAEEFEVSEIAAKVADDYEAATTDSEDETSSGSYENTVSKWWTKARMISEKNSESKAFAAGTAEETHWIDDDDLLLIGGQRSGQKTALKPEGNKETLRLLKIMRGE